MARLFDDMTSCGVIHYSCQKGKGKGEDTGPTLYHSARVKIMT